MSPFVSDFTDNVGDYGFELPEELIAQDPASLREHAKLLVVRRNPSQGMPLLEDLLVKDLPQLILEEKSLKNSLWIRNRSRVIPARFYARRESGGEHEIVLVEEKSHNIWKALVRKQARINYPQKLFVGEHVIESPDAGVIDFSQLKVPLEKFLEENGEMPLPPYIKTRIPTRDRERYQSVWAEADKAKSVAAPTASLHFTEALLNEMKSAGANFADVILHVGLGTFEPMRQPSLANHELHSERIEVSAVQLKQIEAARSQKIPLVPIGTTALRTLESLPFNGTRPEVDLKASADGSLQGKSRLFVRPGFEFRSTSALLTNFHLPESTLFVLVCTFAGSRKLAQEAYRHAVAQRYRFFSFGDASLWV